VSVDERSDVSPEGGDAAIDAALDLLIGEELKLLHHRSAGRGLIIVFAIIAETLEWNADEFSGASRKFCAPVEYSQLDPTRTTVVPSFGKGSIQRAVASRHRHPALSRLLGKVN